MITSTWGDSSYDGYGGYMKGNNGVRKKAINILIEFTFWSLTHIGRNIRKWTMSPKRYMLCA